MASYGCFATAATAAGPVDHRVDAVAGAREHRDRNLLVDQVVLGQKKQTASRYTRMQRDLLRGNWVGDLDPERDPRARPQRNPVDRLRQEPGNARRFGRAEIAFLTRTGHEHQGNGEARIPDERVPQLEAVHTGHRAVDERHREWPTVD